MAVKSIQLGQVWRNDSDGQDYLVTKMYSEVFTQYAVLRPAGLSAPDVATVRVKVTKNASGASLARIHLYPGRRILSLAVRCGEASLAQTGPAHFQPAFPFIHVLRMTEKILAVLFVFIKSVVAATGYGGIALLMAIESACIPLPSELIMPFAGYLVYEGSMKLLWVATAGAIGCNLGSLVAYEIGCYGGRPLVEKYGRWILMGRRELDWADRFFLRWGYLAVLIARLLPVIRTFIALPAGIARMPRGRFHIYTFLGSWPWCFGLAWLGMKLGENWRELGKYFHQLRPGDRSRAGRRDHLVCLVALAEPDADGVSSPTTFQIFDFRLQISAACPRYLKSAI